MKRTVLFALALSLIMLGCSKNCQKQGVLKNEKRVVNVKREGTLSALILPTEKYQITDLTLTGKLNGVDFKFIREMAGRNYRESITAGRLARLNLENANIVESSCYFFSPYTKKQEYCYIKTNTIPDFAFQNLSNLTSITLPRNIISIGTAAFDRCKAIISVTIPNSVRYIGYGAFFNCTGLQSAILSMNLDSIGKTAFGNCKRLATVTVPFNMTSIADAVFAGCSGLTSVIIPRGIFSIGGSAFAGCKRLISVKIPGSVISIGCFAFRGCEGLKEIHCKSKTPPKAASYVFDDTSKACKLYVPKGSSANYKSAKEWKGFTTIIEE